MGTKQFQSHRLTMSSKIAHLHTVLRTETGWVNSVCCYMHGVQLLQTRSKNGTPPPKPMGILCQWWCIVRGGIYFHIFRFYFVLFTILMIKMVCGVQVSYVNLGKWRVVLEWVFRSDSLCQKSEEDLFCCIQPNLSYANTQSSALDIYLNDIWK